MPSFPRLTVRLSRAEMLLLVLATAALLANLYLAYDGLRMGRESQALSRQLADARRAAAVAREDADLAKWEEERRTLSEAVASLMPASAEESKLTLQLWQWAADSGVELREMVNTSKEVELGEDKFIALNYLQRLEGQPPDLNRFLGLALSSDYAPSVDALGLRLAEDGSVWRMTLGLTVVARQQPAAPAVAGQKSAP